MARPQLSLAAAYQDSYIDALNQAYDAGYEVHLGEPAVLLLDFDEPYIPHKKYGNQRVWEILFQLYPGTTRKFWKSKGGNTHCIVYLSDELDIGIRLAWQAALGSDPVREALAIKRLHDGIEEPSMLFQPKEQ